MITIKETKDKMVSDSRWWKLYFYDFVDEFRRKRDLQMIIEPFDFTDEKIDALLASTLEKLCEEVQMQIPEWIKKVPASREPYFVAGVENLKPITLVQTPLIFKVRNVFVTENFLSRV